MRQVHQELLLEPVCRVSMDCHSRLCVFMCMLSVLARLMRKLHLKNFQRALYCHRLLLNFPNVSSYKTLPINKSEQQRYVGASLQTFIGCRTFKPSNGKKSRSMEVIIKYPNTDLIEENTFDLPLKSQVSTRTLYIYCIVQFFTRSRKFTHFVTVTFWFIGVF